MENIMHEVKVLRQAVKMKQGVLAKELGVEQSNYSNMENGKLLTNKTPLIKEQALKILLPMLSSKINLIQFDLSYYTNLMKHFEKDYR